MGHLRMVEEACEIPVRSQIAGSYMIDLFLICDLDLDHRINGRPRTSSTRHPCLTLFHVFTAAGLAKGVAPDALLEVQGLILAVMAEKAAGKASTWAAYLDFIPDDLDHIPMFWKVRLCVDIVVDGS